MKNKKILIGVLCAAIAEIFYGFSYLFTKNITNSVSPLTLLSWRFIIAFIILNICVLLHIIKVNFKNKSIISLISVAIFQPVLYIIGETFGIKLTSASESGTILACIPIVTLLFSALLLKEPPTKLQVIGVGITAIGIITIVVVKGIEATFNPIGYTMLMLAVVSYSLYSVFAQKAEEFTSAEKTYAMMAFGTVVFTIIGLTENVISGTLKDFIFLPFTNGEFLIAALFLGIGGSVITFFLCNIAIASIGTNRAASFVGISTIVSVIAGVIILNEEFSIVQICGTALVIGGVYLANIMIESKKEEIENYQEKKVENG
ncbi:DMT family transporter [Neobacillus drentensis]|uniref:DMT family transporter n=1 Tax=Neobacillus drentensis TaxID=220684 RepID=UPI002FFE46C6